MFQFAVVGQICCDITLSGLPAMPRVGDEIFAEQVSVGAGGVFTTSAWLKKLGGDVTHVAALGDDPLTALIESEVARHGVDLSLCRRSGDASPDLTISLPVDGDRALLSHARALSEPLITAQVLANSRHLHVGGVRHLLDAAVPLSGHSVSLSIGSEDVARGLDVFRSLRDVVDILFVNAREGCALAGAVDVPAALNTLSGVFPVVVMTNGSGGSFATANGQLHEQPAMTAKVVDATGAGDSFAAGFLFDHRETGSVASALRWGAACGARAVSMAGATTSIPGREELERFMEASGWS